MVGAAEAAATKRRFRSDAVPGVQRACLGSSACNCMAHDTIALSCLALQPMNVLAAWSRFTAGNVLRGVAVKNGTGQELHQKRSERQCQ